MTWQLIAYAAIGFASGLFCLLMPVRWLGYNPVRRKHNPGFDAAKAASNMWIVRLFGVLFIALGGTCAALAV